MNLQQFTQQATPEAIQHLVRFISNRRPRDAAEQLRRSKFWPFAVDFVKSTYLFTGGHVATVRNPEGFDYNMVEPWFDFVGHQSFGEESLLGIFIDMDPEPFMDPPSKEDYLKANFLMRQMANAKKKPVTKNIGGGKITKANENVFRGLNSVPPNVFLDLCKPGERYNIGALASASSIQSEATRFATTKSYGRSRYRILYLLSNPKGKGTPINMLSAYPSEMEVIIGGDIKIERFSFAPVLRGLSKKLQDKWGNHGNIAEFKDLVEFVEEVESSARGTSENPGVERYSLSTIEVGLVYVFATIL